MSTYEQAKALADSVATAKGTASWQIATAVNALLKQAQEDHPENVVLGAFEPLTPSRSTLNASNASYDDIRVIVGQIVAVTKPAGGMRLA